VDDVPDFARIERGINAALAAFKESPPDSIKGEVKGLRTLLRRTLTVTRKLRVKIERGQGRNADANPRK
jgi:hypothetical protein